MPTECQNQVLSTFISKFYGSYSGVVQVNQLLFTWMDMINMGEFRQVMPQDFAFVDSLFRAVTSNSTQQPKEWVDF